MTQMIKLTKQFHLTRAGIRKQIVATILLCLILPAVAISQTLQGSIPPPESELGFKIGTDRKLANWVSFVDYFKRLDKFSDRMVVEEIGKTTLGRPFIVATISSPENLKRLDELRDIQRQLSDPRLADARTQDSLIRRGKNIVVVTCSIHSTEVGGTFSCTEVAYRLASSNSKEILQILDEVVLLLVPSLNPDGTDIVADWYRKTLNTPSEGTSPPELYHHYTGHDNNRDWYAFTQIETQLVVDKVLNVWHPQVLHDVHQMGGIGARFFVPPYVDPWEPNVDPAIISGVNALGTSIAWEMTTNGFLGVVTNAIFDAWTPARAYTHYHGGLRILSETASARLATPVEVPAGRLAQGINYHAGIASSNFPKPWPGGRWGIRDIINYQSYGITALLDHAARNRERYLRSFVDVGRRAIEGKGAPFAFILPEPEMPASLREATRLLSEGIRTARGSDAQRHATEERLKGSIVNEPSSAEEVKYYLKTEGLDRLVAILKRGGVEVMRASSDFTVDGKRYPSSSRIVLMRQPYASFAKALLERQRYPDLREYPGGPPRRPYDVTAHTLPLLMNVDVVAVNAPFEAPIKAEPMEVVIQGRVRSETSVRAGLYKSYAPSMDEGWTRWMLDQYRFPYKSVVDAEVRSGKLREKFDAIILPDQSSAAITNGLRAGSEAGNSEEDQLGRYPAEYAGGLGDAGIKALVEFVNEGGTLITFNNASNFPIEKMNAPVRNLLKGVSPREFYCPGSILRIELDEDSPISFPVGKDSVAWFEASPAFEATDAERVRVIARYPEAETPLLSGWILGEQLLKGKAALVEVKMGKGRIVMFGFRPQYRGQSLATFPLVFNALLSSAN
jgi:Zinc carboxypeptidase